MLKWLLVIGVIAAIYFLFIKKSALPASGKKPDAKKGDDDTMVPCEECGVYITVDEAFIKEGKYYCSKSCMEKH
jgi:uncharacterized protein